MRVSSAALPYLSWIKHERDSQVAQEHRDCHFPNARDVDGCLVWWQMSGKPKKEGYPDVSSHLISYVLFKIFLARDVQANAALAKRLGLDLVCCTWDGRNHDVGDCQAFFKSELGWMCDVVSIEPVSSGGTRAGSFGILLRYLLRLRIFGWGRTQTSYQDGVDIYRQDTSTVVCQQGSKGSTDHLGPTTNSFPMYFVTKLRPRTC